MKRLISLLVLLAFAPFAMGLIFIQPSRFTTGGGGSPTYVNDSSGTITYSGGGWTYGGAGRGLGDYSDDVHYTATTSEYAELTFTGTGIELICPKGPGSSTSVQIYVDTVLQSTIDLTGPGSYTPQQNVFSSLSLGGGSHTIKVNNNSGAYLTVDAFIVHP